MDGQGKELETVRMTPRPFKIKDARTEITNPNARFVVQTLRGS